MPSSTSVWSRFLNRQFGSPATTSRRRRDSVRRRNRLRPHIPAEVLEVRTLLSGAGTLDSTFGVEGKVLTDFPIAFPSDDFINNSGSVAVQADGKIVVAGYSYQGATGYDFAVARYNADGSLDSSFGTDGRLTIDFGSHDDATLGVAVQGDKIVVAGYSYQGDTGYDFAVARLNGDGTLDSSFDGDGQQTIDFGLGSDIGFAVAVQGDKIVVAGYSSQGATVDFAVARLNDDGTLDNSFDGDGQQTIDFGSDYNGATSVAVQGDKIVVAGYSYQGATGLDFAVARLNDDGTLDNSFDGDGTQTIDFSSSYEYGYGVAVQRNKIVVSGFSDQGTTGYDFAVARLNDDGTLDNSFDGDGQQAIDFGSTGDYGYGVAVQGDKIVVAGGSYQDATGLDFAVARLNDDGTLDNSFDGDGRQTIDFGSNDDEGFGVAVQSDGNVIVAGFSYQDATGYDFAVARLIGSSNAAPVANAGGPYTVVRGGTVELDASASSDANQETATLAYEWDFDGDNQFDDAFGIAPEFSAAGIEATGMRTITVRVTDAGGLTSEATATVNIVAVALLPDTCDPGQTALVVGGTLGNDVIDFSPGAHAGEITVKLNGVTLGTFSPRGRLIAYGQNGNDDIQVAGSINLSAWLYGGNGDDRLKGGAGDDVLFGEEGNDLVLGGNGRDLLVGDDGADRIIGNADDDIMVADHMQFDNLETAICSIMSEWTSDRSYLTRIANLNGTGTSIRNNGNYFLTAGTNIISDDDSDTLTGSAGLDWFLFDSLLDRATDLKDEVFSWDMDFILS